MVKNNFNRQLATIALLLLTTSLQVQAEAPSGYYDRAEGLNKGALLNALESIVGEHTNVGYNGLWEVFKESDVREDGTIWDMYSTSRYTPGKDQNHGQASSVGDNYNREHSMPKSWFNDDTSSPMYSDAFHLYPTDSKVNEQRGNYPFGECANGTKLPSANGVDALGRLGRSTSGYSGTVFEPDDQYKGDFARTYFYMAAAYNSLIDDWHSDQLAGNSYPVFSSWSVEMLMKWHRQDPVSKKETDRNEVVYRWQGNRNPFIDHPELAEYIWGDKKDEGWIPGGSGDVTPDHAITFSPSTIPAFNATPGTPSTDIQVTASTKNINDPVNVTVTGNFELSLDRNNWDGEATLGSDGGTFYLRMKASEFESSYSGTLQATAGEYSSAKVNITGTVASLSAFFEDFEWEEFSNSGYDTQGTYEGNACKWNYGGIYLGEASSDNPRGERCIRLRDGKNISNGYIEMAEDKLNGAGTLSFYGGTYGNDSEGSIMVSYSTNGGSTWTKAETIALPSKSGLREYSITLNKTGNIRFRFERASGERINIDDISITNYVTASAAPATADKEGWNAYSPTQGQLTLTAVEPCAIAIYSIDGKQVHCSQVTTTTTLQLASGIYIVASGSTSKKVIVK